VITEHRQELSHDFDWDNIKILDEENNYNKRLLSEIIFIHKQNNDLNKKKNDAEFLDPTYTALISKT